MRSVSVGDDSLQDTVLRHLVALEDERRDGILIEADAVGFVFQLTDRVDKLKGAHLVPLRCTPFPLQEAPRHFGTKRASLILGRIHPLGQAEADLLNR